ncbi:Gp138 family membrane-puncturing spike protein [Ralstonia mannitolilytica]
MPGIIQSFNAGAVTATVQLAIKGIVHAPDGTAQFVNMPLLVDVPVHFPRGGGCTLTFPVAKGDECLVVFAARCIDGWWQSGGVQAPMDPRIHDLSDGFAFVGFFSQATKIGGISTASTQLRSNDGATYIDLNPSTKKVKIVAPGGFDVIAPLSTFSAGVTISGLGGLFTSSLFLSSLGNGEVTLSALPASLPFELALCFATRFAVKARLFAVSPLCRSKFGSEIPSSETISQPTLAISVENPVTPAMRSSNAALTPGALPSSVC